MKLTGAVIGHAAHFGHAFAKAQTDAGTPLPQAGAALITVNDFDQGAALKFARELQRLGFTLYATSGIAAWLARASLPVTAVKKVNEGHPNIQARVESGELQLNIITPLGARPRRWTHDVRGRRAAQCAAADDLERRLGCHQSDHRPAGQGFESAQFAGAFQVEALDQTDPTCQRVYTDYRVICAKLTTSYRSSTVEGETGFLCPKRVDHEAGRNPV
jgi:hypothetical protein